MTFRGWPYDRGMGTIVPLGAVPNDVWVTTGVTAGAPNTVVPAPATLLAVPLPFYRAGRIDRIGFVVSVVGGAGSLARCGMYASATPNSFWPSTLVVDGGEHAVDVGVGGKVTNIDIRVNAALQYWCVYLGGGGVGQPTIRSLEAGAVQFGVDSIVGATTTFVPWTGLSIAQAYGALPAAFPAGPYGRILSAATTPMFAVRYSE